MKKIAILISFVLLLTSCKTEQGSEQNIKIDISSFSVDLKEVSDEETVYIPLVLPDSVFFGFVNHIKVYNDLIFLHDEEQTSTLTIFNHKGELINQLNKIGDGPGEYRSVSAFSYSEEDGILTIYGRGKLSLSHFKVPELTHLGTNRVDKYLMNIEYINKNTLVAISEEEMEDEKYEGILYISKEGKVTKKDFSIGRDPSSMELSFHNTMIKTPDGVFYAHPHEITTIYKMGDIADSIYTIDFEKNKIPARFWPLAEAQQFEQSMEEGNKAVWVQNMILNQDELAFSFLYKDIETRYFYSRSLKDMKSQLYKGYTISNSDYTLPHPIGSDGNNFLSLIYTENIDETAFQNERFLEAYRKSESNGGYLIVKYKP
ncbi:6-bladed beta-propeller [Roseivirga echinicomitans]